MELLYQDILYKNPGCSAVDFTEVTSFSEQCAWSLQDCVCVCVCGRKTSEAIPCNIATLEYSEGHFCKAYSYTAYILKEIW